MQKTPYYLGPMLGPPDFGIEALKCWALLVYWMCVVWHPECRGTAHTAKPDLSKGLR